MIKTNQKYNPISWQNIASLFVSFGLCCCNYAYSLPPEESNAVFNNATQTTSGNQTCHTSNTTNTTTNSDPLLCDHDFEQAVLLQPVINRSFIRAEYIANRLIINDTLGGSTLSYLAAILAALAELSRQEDTSQHIENMLSFIERCNMRIDDMPFMENLDWQQGPNHNMFNQLSKGTYLLRIYYNGQYYHAIIFFTEEYLVVLSRDGILSEQRRIIRSDGFDRYIFTHQSALTWLENIGNTWFDEMYYQLMPINTLTLNQIGNSFINAAFRALNARLFTDLGAKFRNNKNP